MTQGILKKGNLNPDGIRIVVPWDRFAVGASVFIPCVNTSLACEQVKKTTKQLNIVVNTHVTVCDSKLGVRVWRLV